MYFLFIFVHVDLEINLIDTCVFTISIQVSFCRPLDLWYLFVLQSVLALLAMFLAVYVRGQTNTV